MTRFPPCRRNRVRPLLPALLIALNCLTGVFLAGSIGTTDAHAATSEWATNEGGRMRLVTLPPGPDGKMRGALQIEPKAGWITYWREPGDAGIPPKITFPQTDKVKLTRMAYPTPKRIDTAQLKDIGYDGPVAFPFELTLTDPDQPVMLSASAFVGLCLNICIPFQADFALPLGKDRGTPVEEAMVINSAEAQIPPKPTDDFAVTHYAMMHGGDTLRLTIRLPKQETGKPTVIVTGPEGHVLVDGINAQRIGDSYSLDMPVGKLPKGYEITGKHWGILVIAGNRSIETSLAFD
ncbi:MAG: protein-disulfide reductase DsbD family protein [Neorhizobium sp.]|nr:protein-disulfide reductase DsbD family protein [Neorhizobium sp.]